MGLDNDEELEPMGAWPQRQQVESRNRLRIDNRLMCTVSGLCLTGALVAIGFNITEVPNQAPKLTLLVSVQDGQLVRGELPRRFMGANLWYAVHLGWSDRDRLSRELDRLKEMGVSNVRITALTEGPDEEPWRVVPTLQPAPGQFVEAMAVGLDTVLALLEDRGMDAIITLANMWPWSGGLAQYVAWSTGERIPYPPPEPGGSWAKFQAFAARFYTEEEAMQMAEAAIRFVVGRNSSLSGRPLAESPAILAWELCNEPRGDTRHDAYHAWLQRSAALVKSLDPNHLLTIGSEGSTPFADAGVDVMADHAIPEVDFMTIHIWPQNWNWYEPVPYNKSSASLQQALLKAADYLRKHVLMASSLGKPLVLEEFGLARDAEGFTHQEAPDSLRRAFYAKLFSLVVESQRRGSGSTVSGVSFWAWAGEGRPRDPGQFWKPGDDLIGDPPHERQGWYSVYDDDMAMASLVASTARQINVNASAFYRYASTES